MALRAVPDHPKFADLKARLSRPKYVALGCLEAIWHFTGRFTPQGNIGKYPDTAIEAWVEWDGEPGELIAALTDARWLDFDQHHRLIVHDWHQHAEAMVHTTLARDCQLFANGAVPETGRLNQHERARFHTWLEHAGITPRPMGRPAKSQTQDSQKSDSLTDVSAKKPKPSLAKPSLANTKDKDTCVEASSTLVPDKPEVPAMWEGQPLTLQTVSGEAWPVPASDCVAWAEAYPGVNVLQELLKMRVWLQANAKNRKTCTGMRRFINSWLSRAQDKSHPAGGSGNGFGNRGQARTDGNISAARIAEERLAARLAHGVS